MTKHEIEEAINQGKCRLDITINPAGVRLALTGEDDAPIIETEGRPETGADADALSHLRDSLRAAYRELFNRVESEYSQKLCRVSSVRVTGGPGAGEALLRDALPLSYDGAGRAVLTEEAARLLDPVGDLRPGVPVALGSEAPAERVEAADDDVVTVVDPASPPEGEKIPVPGEEEEPLPEPSPVPEELMEDGETGFPRILEDYQASLAAEIAEIEAEEAEKEVVGIEEYDETPVDETPVQAE